MAISELHTASRQRLRSKRPDIAGLTGPPIAQPIRDDWPDDTAEPFPISLERKARCGDPQAQAVQPKAVQGSDDRLLDGRRLGLEHLPVERDAEILERNGR
jgi:hypothetical protein